MPRAAATFSAYGLLFADAVHSVATTAEWIYRPAPMDEINALYERLEKQARGALANAGYADEDVTVAPRGRREVGGPVVRDLDDDAARRASTRAIARG